MRSSGKLKAYVQVFKRELKIYYEVAQDKRTPRIAKFLLGAAVAYAVSPIDIIPDFIPIISHLDDIIIIPLLIYLSLRFIPKEIIDEKRTKLSGAYDSL